MACSPERVMAVPGGIETAGFHRIEAFRMDRPRIGTFKGLPMRETDGAVEEGEGWLRCINCGGRIAKAADQISVNGRFAHVFNNPSGYVYEIGCFAAAEGCVNAGAPTPAFTWFAGFSWCLALCGNCRGHMGWHFRSDKSGSFYGLILVNLTRDSRGG